MSYRSTSKSMEYIIKRSHVSIWKWVQKLKNKMKRFVQEIKDRTECFDDHFPCTKNHCNRLHVYNWLKLYILYIHTNMNKTRFMELLMDGG
jgi:hypothetical protein